MTEQQGPIAVCIKWVPTRPEIDPLSGTVVTDPRFSGPSPADLAALEWALRVGQARQLAVTTVTVGPAEADAVLRRAVAHGASRAVRIAVPGHDDPGSATVAAALAQVCTEASLVFCGDHSLDRGSGSVPAFLADELGYGQALGCTGLELSTDRIVAERRLDQGRRERLSVTGPTVLSFEGGLEVRRAPLDATIDAAEAPIEVVTVTTPERPPSPVVTRRGPYRPRARVLAPPEGSTLDRIRQLTGVGQERAAARVLEVDPRAGAEAAIEQLREWGYLEPAEDRPTDSADDDPVTTR